MEIRLITPNDYDALVDLWLVCRGSALSDTEDSHEAIARLLARNPDTCFAAVAGDGRLVGAILATEDGRRGYIYHMGVTQEFRGQGVGSALVKASLEALARKSVTTVALVACAANDSANAFWERMGFVSRGDLTYRNRSLVKIGCKGQAA